MSTCLGSYTPLNLLKAVPLHSPAYPTVGIWQGALRRQK